MLDDLDRELEKRSLSFVRYADDCNIYVSSKRAGERILESVTSFLAKRLRLKVNKEKTAVGKPSRRTFLGFAIAAKGHSIHLPRTSVKRFKEKIRSLTKGGSSFTTVIDRVRRFEIGWYGYFKLSTSRSVFATLDQWVRRRVRRCAWLNWKHFRGRKAALQQLGVPNDMAAQAACSSKGAWRMSNSPAVQLALSNARLRALGLPVMGSTAV